MNGKIRQNCSWVGWVLAATILLIAKPAIAQDIWGFWATTSDEFSFNPIRGRGLGGQHLIGTFSGTIPPGLTVQTFQLDINKPPNDWGSLQYLVGRVTQSGVYRFSYTEWAEWWTPDGTASGSVTLPIELRVIPAIAIDGLEVSQAIQEVKDPDALSWWLYSAPPSPLQVGDMPVPLVENKPGMLRLFFKPVDAPVTARVRITILPPDAVDSSDTVVASEDITLLPGCSPTDARQHLGSSGNCRSLDFSYSAPEFKAGSYRLLVQVGVVDPDLIDRNLIWWRYNISSPCGWPGNPSELGQNSLFLLPDTTELGACLYPPIKVNKTDVLVVHPVSVCYNPWDLINSCGKVEDMPKMARLLKKVVPAANVQFSWSGDRVIVLSALHPGDLWWVEAAAELEKRAASLPVRAGERHVLYGVVHPSAPGSTAGMGNLQGKSALSLSKVTWFPGHEFDNTDGVMAHEIGHVFGLEHTDTDVPLKPFAPGCIAKADDIDPADRKKAGFFFWPYAALGNWLYAGDPAAPSLEVGLDFTRQIVVGSAFEMMSYCAPMWVTPWSYRAMYSKLAAAAPQAVVMGGRFRAVSGTVTAAGIIFDPIFTIETAGPADPGTGSHRIVIRSDDRSVLYARSFTPHVAVSEGFTGGARSLPRFSELLPDQPGAASISIEDDLGNQLGTLSLGGTAPKVEITFPVGGEVLQGVQNISWSVTDPDSTTHTFWVQYSADGGASWSTVATSYPEAVLPVDFDSLPGTTGRALIRVYASDGINTGEAVSGAFSVSRKLLRATILYPEDGMVLHTGEFLTLEGSGFDPNNGFLSGAALTWNSSSLGGSLGAGEQVTFGKLGDSNIGSHTITLTATSADGSQGTATINITVSPNTSPVALDNTVTTDQDASVSIQLEASDPNNGALTYTVGMPAHGTLSGTAPNLLYQPAPGYFGPDSFTFSVTNSAGAVSNVATVLITVNPVGVVDATPPQVSCGVADGLWHGANVAITCTAVDNQSGLLNPSDTSFTLQTAVPDGEESGNAETGSLRVCDRNNNCATAGPVTGNKVDRRPPVLNASATSSGQPYISGAWVNTDVVVSFSCTDGGSGVNSVTGAQTLSAETRDASVSGSCRDNVGNESAATFGGVRIDKTAPNPPLVTVNPPPNSGGWHHSVPVVVTFSENGDAGSVQSGVLRCTAPVTLAAETASTTVMGTCTDLAGNRSASGAITIKIDYTLPTVACSTSPKVLWPPNNKLVPVNVPVNVSDTLSGPAGFGLVSVTSNEPDSGLGDIQGFLVGTPSTSGLLRAQRFGSGTGRAYTFTYNGADRAGNSASCMTTVSVPHDQGN